MQNNVNMGYISPLMRIIDIAMAGPHSSQCEKYAIKLAEALEKDGHADYAKFIRSKFDPNRNQIIFDSIGKDKAYVPPFKVETNPSMLLYPAIMDANDTMLCCGFYGREIADYIVELLNNNFASDNENCE